MRKSLMLALASPEQYLRKQSNNAPALTSREALQKRTVKISNSSRILLQPRWGLKRNGHLIGVTRIKVHPTNCQSGMAED